MEKEMTTTRARSNFADLVNRAAYGKERVLINRRGKPVAAIVPLEDVELLERIEDEIDVKLARKTLAESEGTTPLEEVVKELGL